MSKGYVLTSPKGKIYPETFNEDKEMVEGMAYEHLSHYYAWPRAYWKKWDEFVKERERRGWKVVPAKVVLT
jgi:hypothetical protein